MTASKEATGMIDEYAEHISVEFSGTYTWGQSLTSGNIYGGCDYTSNKWLHEIVHISETHGSTVKRSSTEKDIWPKSSDRRLFYDGPIVTHIITDVTHISLSVVASVTFIKGVKPIILQWLRAQGDRGKLIVRVQGDKHSFTIRSSEDVDRLLDRLGGIHMVSNYNISGGQQGAVGDGASASDFTQQQNVQQASKPLDLKALADELALVRTDASAKAVEPEDHAEVGSIAAAEAAAKKGDEAGTLKFLKSAGDFALKVAQDVSAKLVVEVLKKQMGI